MVYSPDTELYAKIYSIEFTVDNKHYCLQADNADAVEQSMFEWTGKHSGGLASGDVSPSPPDNSSR